MRSQRAQAASMVAEEVRLRIHTGSVSCGLLRESLAGGRLIVALALAALAAWLPTGRVEGSWSPLGTGANNSVFAIAIDPTTGDVYAGGSFNVAGGVLALRVAKWDGTCWSALMPGWGVGNVVFALAVDPTTGGVYVGGQFPYAGDTSAISIARWDETGWSELAGGHLNGVVRAIAIDPNTADVYVGGDFTLAGSASANRIARWNGATWSVLGTGMDKTVLGIEVDPTTGNVFAGGEFDTAGGATVNHIAMWNGITWSALGTGTSDVVMDVAVLDGMIYAGGSFNSASGIYAPYIAKWDGANWSQVGAGMDGSVHDLEVRNGSLYAGGEFTTAGGVPADRIAKWDGTCWTPLGTGIGGLVMDVALHNGEVYVGGVFSLASGVPASNVAKWTDDPAGITVFPTSGLTTTETGGTATFDLSVDTQPAATVTVPLSSSDATEGTVPASAILPAGSTDPVTVTVTGVHDDAHDGDIPYTIETGDPTSADLNYDALGADDVADVSVTNQDDGFPGTASSFRVDDAGRVFADQTVHAMSLSARAADVAEWVGVSHPVSVGDVLEFDISMPGTCRLSQTACSFLVAGVVSTAPGVTLAGSGSEAEALLALIGIVPVKVTNEGGPILHGDLLVTSSTPGHAMRWAGEGPCPCALVGKALEPMTDEAGVILVLLTAH